MPSKKFLCLTVGLAALICLLSSSLTEAGQGADIVGPLPNTRPVNSTDHNPSARALIETWLALYDWPANKRFDQERYEILNYGVSWKNIGRAILVLRLLPLEGDALSLARERCPGRTMPIDIQIYFIWSTYVNHWVAIDSRGDPGFKSCPATDNALDKGTPRRAPQSSPLAGSAKGRPKRCRDAEAGVA